MILLDTHLQVGSLLFEGLDQIDLTGPFEVLSRIPNSTYRLYGKTVEPVRDLHGLCLTPDAAWADAPQLDVLHVPGGRAPLACYVSPSHENPLDHSNTLTFQHDPGGR